MNIHDTPAFWVRDCSRCFYARLLCRR